MLYKIFTLLCGQNQNEGPDRSSLTGNATHVPLCHRRNCTVERYWEKGQSPSNAWVSAEGWGTGVVHEPRGCLCVCVCLRKQQTQCSDANRNWAGGHLPVARSQNRPLACPRRHRC